MLAWQESLFDGGDIAVDAGFAGVWRRELAEGAWVDHAPGWLAGADELFARLLDATPWRQRDVWMYERRLAEPRLTYRWVLDDQDPPLPVLREMADTLSARYGVAFTQVGANLYRDGSDSVAWHGDRVARELPEAVVAIVSLGATRPFKLRPKGGGRASPTCRAAATSWSWAAPASARGTTASPRSARPAPASASNSATPTTAEAGRHSAPRSGPTWLSNTRGSATSRAGASPGTRRGLRPPRRSCTPAGWSRRRTAAGPPGRRR